MLLNGGMLDGGRYLKPETIALMTRNHIGDLHVAVDGTRPQPGCEQVRFGLDFAVHTDPKSVGLSFGTGTYYWGVTPIDAEGHDGTASDVFSFSYSWPTDTTTLTLTVN